jgi:hypothetical protein
VNRSVPSGTISLVLFLLALLLAQPAVLAVPRPVLPDVPLGTGSASFAGGGAAHASGLNSVFDNPAALSIRDEFQVESGLMGLSAGISPYFLFGSHNPENISYALGYFYDARGGDPAASIAPRQGLIAGASWEAASWAVLGASVHSIGTGAGVGLRGFGIDEDLGALFRPLSAFWTGLAVRNLQESGAGQEPEGYRTHRSYVASLGTGLSGLRLAGVTFHDPDAYYEVRSAGLSAARLSHAFSLASGFTPGGKLGFRGTVLLPPGGAPGFALGTFMNFPLGRGALLFSYTFHAGGIEETGEAVPSHSISLNFRLGSRLDPIPPSVDVRVDKVMLAEDSAGPSMVHFHLIASDKTFVRGQVEAGAHEAAGETEGWAGRKASLDEGRTMADGRIVEWSLVIHAVGPEGLAGTEVKAFRGKDLPPRVIRWDAIDAAGNRLAPGFYAFRMDAVDLEGNRAATAWQLLEIAGQVPLSRN